MAKAKENILAVKAPWLATQWHPFKNGEITPFDVSVGSTKSYWWFYPYDDPKTKKHYDFEWKARIDNRYYQKQTTPPFLSSQVCWTGYNDLETIYPSLAREWDYEKNEKLGITPQTVMAHSNINVGWVIQYFDKRSEKTINLKWDAKINDRAKGDNCPYIGNPPKRILQKFNDLETTHPMLAKQWHPTQNGNVRACDVFRNSNKKFWWQLRYIDKELRKEFFFEWKCSPNSRNDDGSDCPFTSNKKVWYGYNDLETRCPDIAKQWDYEANFPLTPKDIVYVTQKKYHWIDDDGDKYVQRVDLKTIRRMGNPHKGKNQFSLVVGINDLVSVRPKVAEQWHPTKNKELNPCDVLPFSNSKAWFYKEYVDTNGKPRMFEWYATINSRNDDGSDSPLNKMSAQALFVYEVLQDLNIDFIVEKYCDRDSTVKLLHDFYINDRNLAIECDGSQHFFNKEQIGLDEKAFKKIIYNDNLKNQYCYDNNIPLLRIPYNYNIKDSKNKCTITGFITEFILTAKIPKEIIQFYSKFDFSNYPELFGENV